VSGQFKDGLSTRGGTAISIGIVDGGRLVSPVYCGRSLKLASKVLAIRDQSFDAHE